MSRFMAIETGTHTVTAGEATATTLDIVISTKDATNEPITGIIVNTRTDAGLKLENEDVQFTGNTITVANNSTDFVLVADQVIDYIAF